MEELSFAINLLWLRPGGVGGTESFVRSLLEGMMSIPPESDEGRFSAGLAVAGNTAESFRTYVERDERFRLVVMPVNNENIGKRILWQNLHLNRALKAAGYRFCFSPVYDRPLFNGGLRYVSVIHDLQAEHYPEYHPYHEVVYSKMIWRTVMRRSAAVAAISEFVKNDLEETYPGMRRDGIRVIHNAVFMDPSETVPFSELGEKYRIREDEFYFTMSQMIPHKNIETLLRVFACLKDSPVSGVPCRLLVAGRSGSASGSIRKMISDLGLEEIVTLIGYISNAERNRLYMSARAFLFPSVFEGFGIPPVEAMMVGRPVITTRLSCIPEITQDKAQYVDDPYDPEQWIREMRNLKNRSAELDTRDYGAETAARKYLELLRENFSGAVPVPGAR